MQTWGLQQVWNETLSSIPDRKPEKRDHLWASELGKAPVDVWLHLKGTPQTNPPNARSRRKFEAGNTFEWIVGLILKRAGILLESQKHVKYQYPRLMEVTGKVDFVAGGKPDKEKYMKEMAALELPEVFMLLGEQIIDSLLMNFPDGLEEMPLEVKSISSFMFENIERSEKPVAIHRLQAYHYLKAMGKRKANLIYVCRDDLRMIEFPIFDNEINEEEYKSKIEYLTKYYKSEGMPPLEKPIEFDEDIGRFSKNFKVAYSSYLTMLYGWKDQMAFDEIYMKKTASWNRVMSRMVNGDKITKKNEEIFEDIRKYGFNPDNISLKFITSKKNENTSK